MRCFNTKILCLTCWGAAASLMADPAQAGFEVCNNTTSSQTFSFVHKADGAWQVNGWYEIAPATCTQLLSEPLQSRFYYLHLRDRDDSFLHTSVKFCTGRSEKFAAVGSRDCHRQGAEALDYARIDVGRGTRDATIGLASFLKPQSGEQHQHLRIDAVFQSCHWEGRGKGKLCSFVGANQEILVRSDEDAEIGRRLDHLKSGTAVTLEGELLQDLRTTYEMDLKSLKVRPSDEAHKMLMALQGTWVSKRDPNDSFTVAGATRSNSYAGVPTSSEYLSVGDSCQEFSFNGLALHTWNKDESQGLCYLIESVSDKQLTLNFLSSGRSLEFQRP